jgi:hypothetical protein
VTPDVRGLDVSEVVPALVDDWRFGWARNSRGKSRRTASGSAGTHPK